MKFGFALFFIFSMKALAFDWQGHRGARGLYPENTIGAMVEALKYPVTTLEFDVVVSKDQKIVVSHEPWMSEEICRGPLNKAPKDKEINLYKMTYEEIQKWDCGSKVHPRFPKQSKAVVGKPLMETLIVETEKVLKSLKRTKVLYNIEIKSTPEDEASHHQPDIATFSDLVIKSLRSLLPSHKYMIQSFDWRVLKYIHEKYPEVRLVALREEGYVASTVLKPLGFNPTVFSPDFSLLSTEDVEFFQAQKIQVIPWTVNEVSDMEALMKKGVDGIITDYPNLIPSVNVKICPAKTQMFEGKCVDVPRNAEGSDENPGWNCRSGYYQKRNHCVRIKVPHHATLSEDGKTWECDKEFVRYRGKCRPAAK